jgi:O-antigen/teichoic acid export membrane protein
MADTAEQRASGGRLLSGTLWNALGRGLPLLLALALTPVLVQQMGIERWGLFTLALAIVGVFGVFDFGVGGALARALSAALARDDKAEATTLAATAMTALVLLSSVLGAGTALLMPMLVKGVLNVPPALQDEAVAAFRLLCLAAPLVVANAALWGTLAALQRFRAANLVSIPVSIAYYLGPVLVLLLWKSLVGVILALLLCRLANTLSYIWLARRDLPQLGLAWPRWGLLKPLLAIGGWMSASGILTQALLYADRFLVGALLTLSAVAFYATPLDLVMRMWILPVAVAQALLPAMASTYLTHQATTAGLLRRGALICGVVVMPACAGLVVLGPDFLRLWLGAAFQEGGGRVLQILAVGMFFSCAVFAPAALLEAIGRPDASVKFQLAQAAVFLPLSALGLVWLGVEGAAAAWALRCATDAFGRLWLAARLYPAAAPAARSLAPALLAGGVGLLVVLLVPGMVAQAAAALLAVAGFGFVAWRALSAEEQAGARIVLRNPRRIRAVLRGEPA